jgi:hypothetical protein
MELVWSFFAGALFCNCIPHLAAGLQGRPFPTPFARPRGVGLSTPLVNVVWGFANLSVGLWLTARDALFSARQDEVAALAGGLAIGVYLALHFGKVQSGK